MFDCFAKAKCTVLDVLHAAGAWLKALPLRRVPLWTAAAGLVLGVVSGAISGAILARLIL